jgi:hypothetical protein
MSSLPDKVNATPKMSSMILSVDNSFQGIMYDKQGMCTQGVRMEKFFSNDHIVDFGGIKEDALRGVRSSGQLRAQPNYDATQLERATMVAQKRDAMPVIGKPLTQPTTLSSFSDDQIIERATSLGVSLEKSNSESFATVKLILDIEKGRTLTMLEIKDQMANENDLVLYCLVVSWTSNLCEDLEDEDELDGDGLSRATPPIVKDKRKRRKKSYDKKNAQRSNRISIKTSKP